MASVYDHAATAKCGCQIKLDAYASTPSPCHCDYYCYCYDYMDDLEVSSVEIVTPCKEHGGHSDGD